MSEGIKLDNRLMAVVELLDKAKVVVDVGCDHGYVPNYLVENKRSKLVYATDISKESLKKSIEYSLARDNFDKVISIMGDGLLPIKGLHYDAIIIAGMGGDLMIKILKSSLNEIKDKILILQPMTVVPKVREFLYANNFVIKREKVVFESGKYYEIIRAESAKKTFEKPRDYNFSEKLIKNCDPLLMEYIEKLKSEAEEIINLLKVSNTEKSHRRLIALEKEVNYYRGILDGCKD